MAARGRKGGPSRMDLRRQNEAAEAQEVEKDEDEDEEEDDEDEEDEESEAADDEGGDDDDDGGDDDDEDAPKKKKKKAVKAKVAVKKAAPKRTRAAKEVRMKALWVVLDNSGKRAGSFPFSEKAEAEATLAKKLEDKPGFYLQLVKEPLE